MLNIRIGIQDYYNAGIRLEWSEASFYEKQPLFEASGGSYCFEWPYQVVVNEWGLHTAFPYAMRGVSPEVSAIGVTPFEWVTDSQGVMIRAEREE